MAFEKTKAAIKAYNAHKPTWERRPGSYAVREQRELTREIQKLYAEESGREMQTLLRYYVHMIEAEIEAA